MIAIPFTDRHTAVLGRNCPSRHLALDRSYPRVSGVHVVSDNMIKTVVKVLGQI